MRNIDSTSKIGQEGSISHTLFANFFKFMQANKRVSSILTLPRPLCLAYLMPCNSLRGRRGGRRKPSRVLGGDDLKLWKPDKQNSDEMVKALKERLAGYFDGEYSIEDFKLTRVDFAVNLDVGSRKSVSALYSYLSR